MHSAAAAAGEGRMDLAEKEQRAQQGLVTISTAKLLPYGRTAGTAAPAQPPRYYYKLPFTRIVEVTAPLSKIIDLL
jgi:hypothetical protein